MEVKNYYWKRPSDVRGGDFYGLKIIVRVDGEEDGTPFAWSAYRGLTDWSDKEVVDHGDKIPEEACRALFPAFARYFDEIGVFYNE